MCLFISKTFFTHCSKAAMTLFVLHILLLPLNSSAQKVSLHHKNAALELVLQDIRQQTGYRVVYSTEQMAMSNKVTIDADSLPLQTALSTCFQQQPLTYRLEDKYIIVALRQAVERVTGVSVRGMVSNEKNEPLSGVSVIARPSGPSTVTDEKGQFQLAQLAAGTVLELSFVGYRLQQLTVVSNRYLTIHLVPAEHTLDDIIVKGYYSSSKRLNTGSVSGVTARTIATQPVSNVLTALEGRMPGVYIAQATGIAGGGININIRGRNSIAAGNDPLYIIDGIPFTSTPLGSSISVITKQGNPLASINPADIEQVEVLKDADATAIYGSRGANGVVLISTKKAVAGKTTATLNYSTGIAQLARKMKLLNREQYLAMRHEAFANDGLTPTAGDIYSTDLLAWDTTRQTDWQQNLLGGTATVNDVQASVSGGAANTQFVVSGNYRRETTVFPGEFAYKKAGLHASMLAASANQRLKLNFSGSYFTDNNRLSRTDPTLAALTLAPVAPPPFDSMGNLNWDNFFIANPYGPLLETYQVKTSTALANAVLSYQLLPGLTAKTSIGYTKIEASEVSLAPLASINPLFGITSGSSSFGNSSAATFIWEPQLEYKQEMAAGKLQLLLGSSLQHTEKQASLLLATNFADDALLANKAAAGSITVDNSINTDNYYQQYKYQGVFARAHYNWRDKYLVNLTARRDGSSRFGPGKQFANFGAAGIAWIFSQEQFIKKHLRFLSFGKWRASYGTTGNDQIPDYGYLSSYRPSTYAYNGNPGLYPARLLNPAYGWELNKKLELALETGFIHDRILLTVSYYRNRSGNQLVGIALPATTGFTTIQGNLPATVENRGWELEANVINLQTKQFEWRTAINLSFPSNKLVSYPGIERSAYANVYVVGKSLNSQYKYHSTGVDPATGQYSFEDINKDNAISFPDDAIALKKVAQTMFGGISNQLQYKQWQCSFFIQVVKQSGYNYQLDFPVPGLTFGNQPVDVQQRWQQPGDIASVQRFTTDPSSTAYNLYADHIYNGDAIIEDASFVRLKNLSLSYTLSAQQLGALHLQQASLYLQAQNIFTISSYKGLDPETMSSAVLPPLRQLSAGIQFTF
ncbi:MAG TPA: SusC/RagA family TonB-linked outer membrane protein [Chitinophagaceae bacterium]|nr:SusC/RagA family TonB-linked outer membrane protein [Chitinophagaceae bacterium]